MRNREEGNKVVGRGRMCVRKKREERNEMERREGEYGI